MERFRIDGPILQYAARISHREYLTRLRWIEDELNNPSQESWYLMRVCQRIQQVLSKAPNEIKLEDQRLEFGKPKPISVEQESEWGMARWLGWLGNKFRILRPDGTLERPGDKAA